MELTFKFNNPYNSCEEVYIDKQSGRHFVLIPYTPYSKQLCTCTPYRGYYEADCPVKAGLRILINGAEHITEECGEIVDQKARREYENKVISLYRLKPEFADIPNYQFIGEGRLLPRLYDYMDAKHFDLVEFKRKDVYCMLGFWYQKEVRC